MPLFSKCLFLFVFYIVVGKKNKTSLFSVRKSNPGPRKLFQDVSPIHLSGLAATMLIQCTSIPDNSLRKLYKYICISQFTYFCSFDIYFITISFSYVWVVFVCVCCVCVRCACLFAVFVCVRVSCVCVFCVCPALNWQLFLLTYNVSYTVRGELRLLFRL